MEIRGKAMQLHQGFHLRVYLFTTSPAIRAVRAYAMCYAAKLCERRWE